MLMLKQDNLQGRGAVTKGQLAGAVGALHGWKAFPDSLSASLLSVRGLQQNCTLQLKSIT